MALDRINALRELERRGLTEKAEVQLFKAKYYLDYNTSEDVVLKTAHKMTRKYVEKLEGEGWELLDLPVCRKVKQIDERQVTSSHLYLPTTEPVWHQKMLATENTIPKAHPWSRPGQDLYIIWVKVQRLSQTVVMEMDDDLLQGMVDKNDPALKGIVIH